MYKLIIAITILFCFVGFFCTENPESVSENDFNWPVSSLAAENFDTNKFDEAIRYMEDTVHDIRSIFIVRNGKIVFEKYYHSYWDDTTFLLNSTTKTIIGILTGIAIEDGLIKGGVKAKVVDFFPEMQFDNLTENKKNMAIEDLLTLRTGLQWDDDVDDFFDHPDPVKYILDKPMDTTAGSVWYYNSGAVHLLSAIITRVSGKSTKDFAVEKLFDPLEIKTFHWEVDCKGIYIGGYGLSLKPKDLAKIGLLYLNEGIWNGKKLISSEWVHTSTDSMTTTEWPENGTMGYLWWINYFGGYSARGANGQNMYIFPDKNLIIVFNSYIKVAVADKKLNIVVKDHLLKAVN